MWGVGCGVWGVGCGVWGVGCRVWGVGCGVWGLRFGVWGSGVLHGGVNQVEGRGYRLVFSGLVLSVEC